MDRGTDRGSSMRACATCGAEVMRRDCHHNRYDEYICRACLGKGLKFTAMGRTVSRAGRWARLASHGATKVALALIGFYVLYTLVGFFSTD